MNQTCKPSESWFNCSVSDFILGKTQNVKLDVVKLDFKNVVNLMSYFKVFLDFLKATSSSYHQLDEGENTGMPQKSAL